jgi:hypothetical protein
VAKMGEQAINLSLVDGPEARRGPASIPPRRTRGRFLVIVPVLSIAGTLASKGGVPTSAGTLPTHGMQFVALLVSKIVIVGGLTFFPALAIGPVAEQVAMQARITY